MDIDEDVIRAFFGHITARLALRSYDVPIMLAPSGPRPSRERVGSAT
jgi:hypothetical protein